MTDPIYTSPERVHETAKSEHVTLPRAVLEQMVGALEDMTDANGYTSYISEEEKQDTKSVREANAALTAGRAVLEKGEARCSYCDGTGDVHTPTGEWRGTCTCDAGKAQESLLQHAYAEGRQDQSEEAQAKPVGWIGTHPRNGQIEICAHTPSPSVIRDFKMERVYTKPPVSELVSGNALLQAIARGWCSEKNSGKIMDPILALAIRDEVQKLFDNSPASEPAIKDGWKPIESAPKDGTEIVAWEYGTGNVEFVRWHDGVLSESAWVDRGAENFDNPTHYMTVDSLLAAAPEAL